MNKLLQCMCGALFISAPVYGQAHDYLNINKVNARINASASLFNSPSPTTASYEVPKGSGEFTMHTLGLWVYASDQNNLEYLSAEKYAGDGRDFAPGPLRPGTADTDSATSAYFDRIWKVNRFDIENFRTHFANGSIGQGYEIPASILSWPGNGPSGYAGTLAPFEDVNNDGSYNPEDGDYPKIKGDQMLWWVVNDRTVQRSSGGTSLGIEVQFSAYAFINDTISGNDSLINYTTFLETRIINRSSNQYSSFRVGTFCDMDVQSGFNDYMGTCVDQNTVYAYNSSQAQGSEAATALRLLQAQVFLHDSVLTAGAPASAGLAGSICLQNVLSPISDPTDLSGYTNLMNGSWKDSSPVLFGDNGYLTFPGALTTTYMYPGSSDPTFKSTGGADPGFIWTPQTPAPGASAPLSGSDIRILGRLGNYTLNSGDTYVFETAYFTLLSDSSSGNSALTPLACVSAELVQSWYDTRNFPSSLDLTTLSEEVHTAGNDTQLTLWPVPAREQLTVELPANSNWNISILNMSGQQILQGSYADTKQVQLPLQGIKAGIYIVRAQNKEGKTYNGKIVIY